MLLRYYLYIWSTLHSHNTYQYQLFFSQIRNALKSSNKTKKSEEKVQDSEEISKKSEDKNEEKSQQSEFQAIKSRVAKRKEIK